jgi:hypothetical protein
MKTKVLVMVAGICAASLSSASANNVSTSFGPMPGATFGGSGIPNDWVEMTTISGISDLSVQAGSDNLTIGLSAHARFSVGDLANNHAGTYYADPGTQLNSHGTPLALWNFDFDINSSAGFVSRYRYVLTYGLEGGSSTTLNPLTAFTDNTGAPGSAQNSENLAFATLGGPIGFNPDASGIYDFTIDAYEGDTLLGSDTIHVNVGNVPEVSSTAPLLAAGFIGLLILKKRAAKARFAGAIA